MTLVQTLVAAFSPFHLFLLSSSSSHWKGRFFFCFNASRSARSLLIKVRVRCSTRSDSENRRRERKRARRKRGRERERERERGQFSRFCLTKIKIDSSSPIAPHKSARFPYCRQHAAPMHPQSIPNDPQ